MDLLNSSISLMLNLLSVLLFFFAYLLNVSWLWYKTWCNESECIKFILVYEFFETISECYSNSIEYWPKFCSSGHNCWTLQPAARHKNVVFFYLEVPEIIDSVIVN